MKKKFIADILAVLITICIVLSGTVTAYALDAQKICDSVVVISVYFDSEDYGPVKFFYGTGFFIGRQGEKPSYLLTNYHVIEMYAECGKGQRIEITDSDTGDKYVGRVVVRVHYDSSDTQEAYVVEYDALKDIALLKLAEPTDKRVPLKICEPDNSMRGMNIYAVGYPAIADNNLKKSTSMWGKNDASISGGILEKLYVETGTGNNMIQLGFSISGGNSGGPIVNEDGAVIGIATEGISNQYEVQKVNYARSISDAVQILVRNRIDYDTQSFSGGSASGKNDNGNTPEPVPTDRNTDSGNVLVIVLLIIIAVLLVGGVAAVIIVLVKKNGKKPLNETDRVTVLTKTPYIRSMAVQHGGARIKMNDGEEILIGRSPDCRIAFKNGTAGVSGKHCTVSYDGTSKCFILKDLRSTYGTYLQDGSKIVSNTAYKLHSGDKFYLGDKSNMIGVDLE